MWLEMSLSLVRSLQNVSTPVYDHHYSCDDFLIVSKPPQHNFEYRIVTYTSYCHIDKNGEKRYHWKPSPSNISGLDISIEDLKKYSLKRPLDHSDIFTQGVINAVGKNGTLGELGSGWKWAGTIKTDNFADLGSDERYSEWTVFVRCQDCEQKKSNKDEGKGKGKDETKIDEDGFETIPLEYVGSASHHHLGDILWRRIRELTAFSSDELWPPTHHTQFTTAREPPDQGAPSNIEDSYAVVGRSRGGNILVSPPPPRPYPVKMHL